jgi:hypothetical protein
MRREKRASLRAGIAKIKSKTLVALMPLNSSPAMRSQLRAADHEDRPRD